MRGLVAVWVVMAVAWSGGTARAASPSAGQDPAREVVVEVRMVAPCPTVLGCHHAVRLVWPDGSIQEAEPLDGADAADHTPTRFAVPAGPVRLDLTTTMITGRTIDGDLLTASAEELTDCSLDLVVPERLGVVPVAATVRYDWPEASQGVMVRPMTPDWSCEFWQPSDRGGRGVGAGPAVVPIQATVCDETGRRTADGCLAAIAAAGRLRVALAVAPAAIAVPDCPDTASCAFPAYAVAFASRESTAWPWSETLLVSLDPAEASVAPWPDGSPPPSRLVALQEGLAGIGGRLGETIAIPTSPPIPDGTEAVCMAALTAGALTRHPAWGVALANEEGFIRVTWPAGWSAREAPEGIVLVDTLGETVARERQVIRVDGGETGPDEWLTCGDVSLAFLI